MKLLFSILFCMPLVVAAQNTAVVETFSDISGRPFFPTQYQDVQGTPYLFDDFMVSDVELTNGKVLKNLRTNINLVTDELHFLSNDGQTMIANASVIRSVKTGSPVQQKFVRSPVKSSFFELLADGKAQLFRQQKKVLMETKAFNSATIQKNFVSDTDILVAYGDQLKVVKSIDDICDVLTPDGSLKKYAASMKLKRKSVDSWIQLVDYFNSQQP